VAERYYPNAEKKLYFPEHNDGILETLGKSVVQGFLDVGAGLVGTVEAGLELTPWVDEDNYLTQVRENIRAEEAEWETDPDTKTEWVASVLGQTLPYMGAALTGGAAAGPLGAAAVGFAVEGQDAYEAAIKRGATEGQANWERGIVGTVNAAIEGFQIGRLLKFSDEGIHTFKKFRRLASKKAWDKVAKEGVQFSKQVLRNSIEEAAEEFLQEGVSLTVPYFVEGREEFGDRDYLRYMMDNADQLGAAALGGAVISPFLGVGRAVVPGMAGPSVESFQKMRQRTLERKDITEESKAVVLREIDNLAERVYGEIPEFVQEANPENKVAQDKHMSLVDRAVDKLEQWEDTRPEYEAGIKEEQAKRFGEVENFIKGTMNDRSLDPLARAAMVKKFMQGKMGQQYTKWLDQDFTKEDYQTLVDTTMRVHAESATDLLKSITALNKMFVEGSIPEKNELKSLEPVLGKSFVKKSVEIIDRIKSKPLTRGQRIMGQFKELFNFPRAMLASTDFSMGGRQGWMIPFFQVAKRDGWKISFPLTGAKAWIKAVGHGYRAFFSEDYADFIDLQIKTHPQYDLLKKSGVFLSERGQLSESEEYFASKVAQSFPGVKASERSYVTTANAMRSYCFYSIAEQWAGTGKSPDLPKLGKILNHLTGRGDLGYLKNLGPALNIAFFAPKLTISHIQKPLDLLPIQDGKFRWSPSQKILAATLAEAFGTGMLVLWLLSKRKGIEVEFNPKSTDFGKVKIGKTRIDFWGGYSQIMRLVARMATGEIKTSAGEHYDIPRMEVVARFLQTKLSPVAGALLDAYRGEDFKGSILEPDLETGAKQLYQRFTPLFLQDTADALYYQGLSVNSIATSGLALHGIGAMTYPVNESSQAMMTKNKYAKNTFGTRWDELGPISQQMLRIYNPLIGETERRARKERTSRKAKARVLQEHRKTERLITKSLDKDVRKELDRLLVSVGGVGRRLSEDWYLNNTKYKQYQLEVVAALNEILPEFTKMDIDPEIKRVMLEEVISSVKKSVRTNLVNQAKIEDLKRL